MPPPAAPPVIGTPRRRIALRRLLADGLAAVLLAPLALTGCTAVPTATATTSGPTAPTAPPTAAASSPAAADASAAQLERSLDRLEQRYDARLGVAVLADDGRRLRHRAEERFAFASANKVFIAAAVLRSASDRDLAAVVRYSRADLLQHAPVTAQHVATGMTVRALLDAMLRFSDNTAADLLVERLGGPAAVQRFLRSIGDATTRVDRTEPELNTAIPGDRRDTTTPSAYARDLAAVLLGDVLPPARRALLERTMRANTTGDPFIRAGVPVGWTVADKTGSGASGTRNDIAVVRAPHREPIVLVLLSNRGSPAAASQDALLADATRAVVAALGGPG